MNVSNRIMEAPCSQMARFVAMPTGQEFDVGRYVLGNACGFLPCESIAGFRIAPSEFFPQIPVPESYGSSYHE